MPKIASAVITLQGTLDGLTFVNSKYGRHVRAARGTKKKAVCNEVLAQNASRTASINHALRPVHQSMKTHFFPFTESQLWQRMLSRARNCDRHDLVSIMGSLQKLELHARYPLSRFIREFETTVIAMKRKLRLTLAFRTHPQLEEATCNNPDSYYYNMLLMFLDKDLNIRSEMVETEWVRLTDEVPCYELAFNKPANAVCYLLVLELRIGKEEQLIDRFDLRGAQLYHVGIC